jgi:hypothetical protein
MNHGNKSGNDATLEWHTMGNATSGHASGYDTTIIVWPFYTNAPHKFKNPIRVLFVWRAVMLRTLTTD